MTELFENPNALREGCRGALDYGDVAQFFADYSSTPLRRLPALARHLGLRDLQVKDESQRLGLNAFKIMGVAYALSRLDLAPDSRLVCASAGNHGRAVAHAGRARGLDVTVYMSAESSEQARQAIVGEGAQVVLVDGTYDDAVRAARDDGGVVISDTAWPGYEAIPHDIMAGYTRILDEARAEWPHKPDVTLIQAGVGSFAAACAAWWGDRFGAERAYFVCVEPVSGDALLQSARAERYVVSTQAIETIMAGLGCAEPSSLAVPILLRGADAFVSIEDDFTREAMRLLEIPRGDDPAVFAGPSGAAGLGGVLAMGIRKASVMVVNTEGRLPG